MTAKEGVRADKFQITGIASERRGDGSYLMSPGLYGPQTLVKEVLHFTMGCPECQTEGRYDHRGEVVCDNDECGCVISGDAPMMLPEDHFSGRAGGDGGTGVPAIATPAGTPEADVQ